MANFMCWQRSATTVTLVCEIVENFAFYRKVRNN